MTSKIPRTSTMSIRLTTTQREQIEAYAASAGIAPAQYILRSALKQSHRPLPALAAAGELFAICHALLQLSDRIPLDEGQRSAIHQNAKRLNAILRLHGPGGTA
jgi:16S rRNA U1498 N3-methylase RsmE